MVLRRLLRVPWTARRSNQSILRESKPEYSVQGLMLKRKLQYFGNLMRTDNSLEKFLMLGKIESRRRRGHQRMQSLNSTIDAKSMNLGKLQKMARGREAWSAAVQRVTKSQTQLNNFTSLHFTVQNNGYTKAESFGMSLVLFSSPVVSCSL